MHRFLFYLLIFLVFPVAVEAKDYFLTIGGGYSPKGNQVSLEKNVLYFSRGLEQFHVVPYEHAVLFSDGKSPGRDVQFVDPQQPVPKANQLLAEIFQQTKGLDHRYRDHQLPMSHGPSSRAEISRWFDELAKKLQPGDRVILYCTGHGGKGKPKTNPHFYLWNGQRISTQEWVKELEKLPSDVTVISVMVQCYSGGFGNLIFNEGQAKQGLCSALRCGFFATTDDRVASGCTPDINEANYQDYTTHFWSALFGLTRLGDVVERPDYNKDGEVSLAEAHAYAQIQCDSIDIPTRTSEVFLREHSRLEPKPEQGEALLSTNMNWEQIETVGSPAQIAVLKALAQELGLETQHLHAEAKRLAETIHNRKSELDKELKQLNKQKKEKANAMKKVFVAKWPELENPWSPLTHELLSERPEEIVETIQSHRDYPKFAEAQAKINELNTQKLDHTRTWAKCQRVRRVVENIALTGNLSSVADEKIQDAYLKLFAAEQTVLFPQAK